MPRKEDRWQNIEEILSFWDNENQIEEEKLQRKGLLRKTIFAVVVALLVVVGISAWCVSRKREVTFADEYGNLYQVKSEDSLTCRLMGRGIEWWKSPTMLSWVIRDYRHFVCLILCGELVVVLLGNATN